MSTLSFVLCHDCFSWVQPRDSRCPQCLCSLEIGVPDPTLHDLQSLIGDMVGRVGEVKVQRKLLPDRGMLYETSQGLYFLPHRIEHVTQLVETNSTGASFFWTIAAMAWYPLLLLMPFVKSRQFRPKQLQVCCPQLLSRDDGPLLPGLLMENPGAFFVPRGSVHLVSRRRNQWVIERKQGSRLKLKPVENVNGFHERLSQLVSSDPWRHVIVN